MQTARDRDRHRLRQKGRKRQMQTDRQTNRDRQTDRLYSTHIILAPPSVVTGKAHAVVKNTLYATATSAVIRRKSGIKHVTKASTIGHEDQ